MHFCAGAIANSYIGQCFTRDGTQRHKSHVLQLQVRPCLSSSHTRSGERKHCHCKGFGACWSICFRNRDAIRGQNDLLVFVVDNRQVGHGFCTLTRLSPCFVNLLAQCQYASWIASSCLDVMSQRRKIRCHLLLRNIWPGIWAREADAAESRAAASDKA